RGLPGGEAGRVVAGVAERQAQREERHSQDGQHEERGTAGDPGPALDQPAPASPRRRPGGTRAGGAPDPEAVDTAAGEAEGGGQQGHGGGHDDEHGDHGAERGAVDERQAEQEQAEERDDHGRSGEEHRPAGGGQGDDDRGLGRRPLVQCRPVAGHDEERVVDPDAEPDEGGEFGGEGGHDEAVADQVDGTEGDGDAEDRRGDGQEHGNNRPEGQQQDDHGGENPESLAG